MKRLFYVLGFLLLAGAAFAQYTLTSQQPASTASYSSYPNSVTTKRLPSNVLSHCYGNTSNCSAGDAIAKCAMTDCGNLSELGNPTYMGAFYAYSPGTNDNNDATFYSAATDPYYEFTTASGPGGVYINNVIFHAPNAATWPEGVEASITIWDQFTGWVVGIYKSPGGGSLPAASGCGTLSSPCVISGITYKSAATNLFTSIDYGYGATGSSPPVAANASIGVAPEAGIVREQELSNGVINHALLFTTDCVGSPTYSVSNQVFPAIANPLVCGSGVSGSQNADRPSAGTLLFLDYTPAQIAAFNLPAWQTTFLTALSTYGAYIAETNGNNTGLEVGGNETVESSAAWKFYYPGTGCSTSNCYNDPFWPWAETQKAFNGSGSLTQTGCGAPGSGTSVIECAGYIFTNIPRTIGPEGSDAEGNSCTTGSGCYPSGHIHVADPCIAKGYAGVSGGCS
jgi:hypothetical protein